MNQGTDKGQKTRAIEAVIAQAQAHWPIDTAPQVGSFVRHYFAGVAPEDMAIRRVDDLGGIARSHWGLGCTREPGQPLIHVYNPAPEQHGWQSSHTILQIVTDDMPFLVDSVSMALNGLGLTIHLVIHPVLTVRRDQQGHLQQVCEPAEQQATRHEAWMHFEIDRQTEPQCLQEIQRATAAVLEDVRVAVEDWQPMREQLARVISGLPRNRPPVAADALEEVLEFLCWIRDDHFTFLGYRRYDLCRSRTGDELRAVADSGLGLLRQTSAHQLSSSFAVLPENVRSRARDPEPLILTKSNSRSSVHRPGYLDYIGIKRYDHEGEVIGEHRFLGLFTSSAYNRSPRAIPLLRRKVACVLERAKLRANSHAGKALANILETHPRDELFQASIDELYDIALGILHLQERQRVRLFVRYDAYQRFVSCLVFAPRERYNTEIRQRMEAILQEAFGGSQSEFSVQISESILARIHFIVRLKESGRPAYDHAALEQALADTMRSWPGRLAEALRDHYGEETGNRLFNRYGKGFNAAYREDTDPRTAVHDIELLETLQQAGDLAIRLYRPPQAREGLLRFKLFHAERPIILSDVLPVLENMGVRVIDERPYTMECSGEGVACWIDDFGLCYAGPGQLEAERIRETFQETFAAVWRRQAENDGFNRLVLTAELAWRDIVILRAYAKYLHQVGTAFSQNYVEDTLAGNPQITPELITLFKASFDPRYQGDERPAAIAERIEGLLEAVASLDEDRILRRLLAAIQATVRTNYFRTDSAGNPQDFLSLKLRPQAIPHMPKPVPAYEIYVYSPRVEGVHLRGGKVARGGIRWSERREDFRTEILGLMKAQMVKNAVIVPVGAKGGFVCKNLPEDRQALPAEVQACYRIFIRGLLDVTDNITEGRVVPPPNVVRHDDDDPYLVVAADKGTARFSDFANEIAAEYDFWLCDAFASGGSTGYDHKKMGITARGAWEAVKRHFREMGRDVHSEPFTAIGIGDMSGDVFGNGLLRSRQTRLIAAFDHRHIFIDPNPNAESSYRERQRLFGLERSSWADYDQTLISEGGGVWSRHEKSITLSPQVQSALATRAERLTPNELISTILRAPADLLWNGGIGTYVKASTESHAEVGDKTNDAVRIDADELRCQIIGEGGNLGLSQLGRVEFALAGGRINTDAIDNSGGVDCSDHEVNIKILLNRVADEGGLTLKQRNELLMDMTETVAELVLHNNYRQSESLTLYQARAPELLDEQLRFMRELEHRGHLDRRVEQLPDDEGIAERQKAGIGLTRPELAVLQAYAKIDAYETILRAEEPPTEHLASELSDYFPPPLRERFPGPVAKHPLGAEIIATQVANHIVNRMGSTFLFRIRAQTGGSAINAALAYFAGRDIYDLRELWRAIDRLDNQVPAELQTRMLRRLSDLQERATLWLLRNLQAPIDIGETVARIRPAIIQLDAWLDELLPQSDRDRLHTETTELTQAGVPPTLARQVAHLEPLYSALDLVKVCAETKASLERATCLYFGIATHLELNWLRDTLVQFEAVDSWQERYRAGLEDEFYVQLRLLTMRVLTSAPSEQPPQAQIAHWAEEYRPIVAHLRGTLDELEGAAQPDLAMLGVAVQELRTTVQAGAAQRQWLIHNQQPSEAKWA
ncbi:NAD-glutamate dehydrogenase [Nitrococcus mobilis]|uniref:NAD-glutamate dehydrogenase n=1 Tax=Nitrococcus mobilis Nb-231 TaxID=314278 RepID=A4BNN6_9GAMM|nr:NAD-glutamate dehydrogenase [Nitrococcus mobilis]EAR22835.1 NAD-glutamate dehydrogenase [Nitrococcus mobilis Nb-231]